MADTDQERLAAIGMIRKAQSVLVSEGRGTTSDALHNVVGYIDSLLARLRAEGGKLMDEETKELVAEAGRVQQQLDFMYGEGAGTRLLERLAAKIVELSNDPYRLMPL